MNPVVKKLDPMYSYPIFCLVYSRFYSLPLTKECFHFLGLSKAKEEQLS